MKKNAATDSNPFRGKHHNRAQGPFCRELHHMCLWSPYRAQQEHPLDGASDTGLSSSASSQLKLPQTLVRAPSTDLRSSAYELSQSSQSQHIDTVTSCFVLAFSE